MTKTKTVYSFVQLFILPRLLYFVLFQQVKLVNISSNDIVDGNPKLTLGLVWSIILHWQVRKKNNKKMRGREIFFEQKGKEAGTVDILASFFLSCSLPFFTTGSRRFERKHGRIAAIEPRSHPLSLVSGSHKSDYLNAPLPFTEEVDQKRNVMLFLFIFMAL